MPMIRPSAYLRNNYNEISELCHTKKEPIFITKNGYGDLVVMSIDTYERYSSRYELYHRLDEGLEDEKSEHCMDFDEFMEKFWKDVS